MFLHVFLYYFLLFMLYSIAGWMIEVIVVGIEKKKFINRGFFIGPYCPIYGFSAVMMILLLGRYQNDPFVLFVLSLVLCTFFEYITSYIMEKMFNARWWDYSDKTLNINGRVCLENSVFFGILGCGLIMFVNPFITNVFANIPDNTIDIFSAILLIVFVVDTIFSFNIISKFKDTATNFMRKDNTEEISEKVKETIGNKSYFGKRLIEAFPNVKAIIPNLKAKYEEQKRKLKEKIR